MRRVELLLAALLLVPAPARAQRPIQPAGAFLPVEVDARGVLRRADNGAEVAFFGVNYTAPFAYAYRAHGYVGADRKASIDMDVSHLARLGLDAYRIHVWDREISDRQGNIVPNEHLDLLDYLISRLEQRGIHVVLTPIVWGGPGYPEPDPPTSGFSNDYSKGAMTVDTAARRVERTYLRQFVNHANPYTGRSYRDDPAIIAIEEFNEPVHPGSAAQTTDFIDDLAAAARQAGWHKPVFYNVAQGWSTEHARAVCAAAIQGITFQWYPTGLVRGGEIRGNMLPNVDRYPIPFDSTPGCLDKARIVYEFDAADVMGSYMYPAVARSFRAAGMQFATQFAYDPAAIAFANTEYQTHFLNLLYTPGKAISLLIAGEAFRRLPRGGSYGAYPASSRFGPFRVSYVDDLSEMNAPDAFYHSNDTRTRPVDAEALRHVAGRGSSPVVDYEGAGAYFLDRLEPGVWRLEVYPDALLLKDPFGRNTVQDEVARLVWRTWPMSLRLKDLGETYTVAAVDAGHHFDAVAAGGGFDVRPGVYVRRRRGAAPGSWTDPAAPVGNRALGEFLVPTPRERPVAVVHRPATEVAVGEPYPVRAMVVSGEAPTQVVLRWRHAASGGWERAPMRRTRGYEYAATLPAAGPGEGALEYAIDVQADGRTSTSPAAAARGPGPPAADSLWRVPVVARSSPIVLFDAARDRSRLLYPHPWQYVRFATGWVDADGAGGQAVRVDVQSLAPEPHEFALRAFLGQENRTRLGSAADLRMLRVRARAVAGGPDSIVVALVQRDGSAWGAVVALAPEWREVTVPLRALRPTPLALLPRSYPQFLPEHFAGDAAAGHGAGLVASELDGIQVTVPAELYDAAARQKAHGFELARIQLERAS
jgi:hypothetical protein